MTVSAISDWPASHLRAADIAFAALTCQPAPLTLDCAKLAADTGVDLGMPAGDTSLAALRDWLLRHRDNYAARDAVWRELILRARLRAGPWRVAAVGMAMPALRRLAGQLSVGYRGDGCDIDAEILTGFLTALDDEVDLSKPAPYASLLMAAFRAGRALRIAHDAAVPVADIETVAAGPRSPQRPYGHPDLLVERAHALGLIACDDVHAWIDVRLGRRAIEPIATRLGVTVDCLRMRLNRADQRLAVALATGLLTGVANPEAAQQLAKKADRGDAVRAGKATRRHPTNPLPATATPAKAA